MEGKLKFVREISLINLCNSVLAKVCPSNTFKNQKFESSDFYESLRMWDNNR